MCERVPSKDGEDYHLAGIYESEVYETCYEDKGFLFKALVKEHGRCVGKIYIDDENDKSKEIGWSFLRREQYTDCAKTYLKETWVTLYSAAPTKTIEYHYL